MHSSSFSLYGTMSASEIGNDKMDQRKKAFTAVTPRTALEKKLIKEPTQLTCKELTGILDELLVRETEMFSGASTAQTIYTCLYLLDSNLYKQVQVLNCFCTSCIYMAYEYQEILKNSITLKEDEFSYSHVQEQIVKETPSQIEDAIIKAFESVQLEKSQKPIEDHPVYDALYLRLKYRQVFMALVQIMSLKDKSKFKKAVESIKLCKEMLRKIIPTLSLGEPNICGFNDSVIYTFPIPNNYKKITALTRIEACNAQMKMLAHFEKCLEIEKIVDSESAKNLMKGLIDDKPMILTRCLIESCILLNEKEQLMFGSAIEYSDMVINSISHFYPAFNSYREQAPSLDCIKHLGIFLRDTILTWMRSSTSQQRFMGIFLKQINYILQECSAIDNQIMQKNPQIISKNIFITYSISLSLDMIERYIHNGFDTCLYSVGEYQWIFNYMRLVYDNMMLNRKIMCCLLAHCLLKKDVKLYDIDGEGTNNAKVNKIRKKLLPQQKQLSDDYLYFKGLKEYCDAFVTLIILLEKEKFVNTSLGKYGTLKQSYDTRFDVFKKYCNFPTYFSFEDYTSMKDKLLELSSEKLGDAAKDKFMAAMKTFKTLQSIDTGIRNIDGISNEHLEKVMKLCVKNSLVPMMIKLKVVY